MNKSFTTSRGLKTDTYTSKTMSRSGGSHFFWRNSLVGNVNKSFTTSHGPKADNLRQRHSYDGYHSEINIYNPGRRSDRVIIPYNSQSNPHDKPHDRLR